MKQLPESTFDSKFSVRNFFILSVHLTPVGVAVRGSCVIKVIALVVCWFFNFCMLAKFQGCCPIMMSFNKSFLFILLQAKQSINKSKSISFYHLDLGSYQLLNSIWAIFLPFL